MSSIDEIVMKCQCGAPVFLDDICAIFPVTLREIAELGYDSFLEYLQILTMEKPVIESKDELAQLLETLSTFQYFLMMATLDAGMNQKVKSAFYFFTHENVILQIEPPQIVVGPLEEKHIIDEEKFMELRKILRRMYFLDVDGEEDIVIYDNDSPRVKALKKQRILNRQKLAKAKAKQRKTEKTDIKFSDLIGSVAIGNDCGLHMGNIYDLTYYAFHDQLKRMGWREQFDINNRAALAGAKIDKKDLKHWIKSIAN